MALEINTINDYFSKIYSKEGLAEFNKKLIIKLSSYKYPSEICLSSDYQNGTLLGTLTFLELDINGYPTYTGDVVKSEGFSSITYSTRLNFVIGARASTWVFTLTQNKIGEVSEIIINSSNTTSLDPTKVNYNGISTPTSGACRR